MISRFLANTLAAMTSQICNIFVTLKPAFCYYFVSSFYELGVYRDRLLLLIRKDNWYKLISKPNHLVLNQECRLIGYVNINIICSWLFVLCVFRIMYINEHRLSDKLLHIVGFYNICTCIDNYRRIECCIRVYTI